MSPVFLAWYISGLLTVLHLLTYLISVAPGGEGFLATVWLGSALGAISFAGLAMCLGRLPRDRWLRRSRPVLGVMTVLAGLATLLVLLVG